MIRGCDYKRQAPDGRGLMPCGSPATHVCLVECIGEEGAQSRVEHRCTTHAGNSTKDVIEAFTYAEWSAMDEVDNPRQKGDDDGIEYADPRDRRNGVE